MHILYNRAWCIVPLLFVVFSRIGVCSSASGEVKFVGFSQAKSNSYFQSIVVNSSCTILATVTNHYLYVYSIGKNNTIIKKIYDSEHIKIWVVGATYLKEGILFWGCKGFNSNDEEMVETLFGHMDKEEVREYFRKNGGTWFWDANTSIVTQLMDCSPKVAMSYGDGENVIMLDRGQLDRKIEIQGNTTRVMSYEVYSCSKKQFVLNGYFNPGDRGFDLLGQTLQIVGISSDRDIYVIATREVNMDPVLFKLTPDGICFPITDIDLNRLFIRDIVSPEPFPLICSNGDIIAGIGKRDHMFGDGDRPGIARITPKGKMQFEINPFPLRNRERLLTFACDGKVYITERQLSDRDSMSELTVYDQRLNHTSCIPIPSTCNNPFGWNNNYFVFSIGERENGFIPAILKIGG